jgi:hypothetical protein
VRLNDTDFVSELAVDTLEPLARDFRRGTSNISLVTGVSGSAIGVFASLFKRAESDTTECILPESDVVLVRFRAKCSRESDGAVLEKISASVVAVVAVTGAAGCISSANAMGRGGLGDPPSEFLL